MRAVSIGNGIPPSFVGDSVVGHNADIPQNLPDISVGEENWFAKTCRCLFEHKAGTILHYISGVDERSCQRYAAGTVKPPAWFLRKLLRDQGGFTWLCAIMDGCDAVWWHELQTAIEIVSKFKIERR